VVSQARRKKFLSTEILDRIANEMTRLAGQQGINVAVAGGLAMQIYGSDRLTMDVDFVADKRIEGLTVKGEITFGGDKLLSPDGVPVDWIVREDGYAPLYKEALLKAEDVEGHEYRVVTLPYLAAMKLVAGRPKDELDLMGVLVSDDLDVEETRGIILKHLGQYAADDFDSRIAEARWRKESQR